MKMLRSISFLTLCLATGCGDNSGKTAATTNTPGSNPLNAPADYVGALDKGRRRAISTLDIASLTSAIQIFNAEEGRFPKTLDELVQKKTIAKIPDAPYGMKIDYDPNTGAVTVVKAQ